MNSKLEQQSKQILKKWDVVYLFEEKNNEINEKTERLEKTIEELNKKLHSGAETLDDLRKALDQSNTEKLKNFSVNEEMRKQISKLKSINEDLISKNTELENKFKRSLETKIAETKEISNINSSNKKGIFNSNSLNSISNKIEQANFNNSQKHFMQPQLNSNSSTEFNIDELKPQKFSPQI